MDVKIKAALPHKAQGLVNVLESFAGFEIEIKVGLPPLPPEVHNLDPDAACTDVDEKKAIIYLSKIEPLNVVGIVHELLHIERYWLEQIPELFPIRGLHDARYEGLTTIIENSLEHLVIIPKEAHFGYDTFNFWNSKRLKCWAEIEARGVSDDTRVNGFLVFAAIQTLGATEELRNRAEKFLADNRLLNDAFAFTKEIQANLGSKERCVIFAAKFFGLQHDLLELVCFDPKNRIQLQKKLTC